LAVSCYQSNLHTPDKTFYYLPACLLYGAQRHANRGRADEVNSTAETPKAPSRFAFENLGILPALAVYWMASV